MSATLTMDLGTRQRLAAEIGAGRRTPSGTIVPTGARPVTRFASAAAPAYGAGLQIDLLDYTVPQNWQALIYGVVMQFTSSAGPFPLPGDLNFSVDIDRPLGVTNRGYTEKDYGSISFPLGNLTTGPYWPVEWIHVSGEALRIKAYTVANVSTGAGSFFAAAILGWEWSAEGWE